MKKYRVVIEETISEEFEIEAMSERDAVFRAIQEYDNGNFVVGSDNVECKKISVIGKDGEFKDWIMF